MAVSSTKTTLLLLSLFFFVVAASAGNFYESFDITWGDGRAKILEDGQLLTCTLDKISGSGFQSKKEYLYGKIDMKLKLVAGNSAGTVTAYYVRNLLVKLIGFEFDIIRFFIYLKNQSETIS